MSFCHLATSFSTRRAGLCAGGGLAVAIVSWFMACSASEGQDKVSDERIRIEFSQGKRFGLMVKDDENRFQKITFFPGGQTNRTHVKVADREVEFGSPAGRWLASAKRPVKGGGTGPIHVDSATWVVDNVHVTQDVRFVGPMGQRDTCEVVYSFENKAQDKKTVALRVVIDTYIADNDGCPFLVKGKKPGEPDKLIRTPRSFATPHVPDQVYALQKDDRANPGLVARLQLTGLAEKGIVEPTSLFITSWAAASNIPQWELKLENDAKPFQDSAVVIYWSPRDLDSNQSCTFGYRYGKGTLPKSK